MTKHLLFLVAAAGLIFANSGCTSKKADDDQQIVENADVEKIEADGLDLSTEMTEPSLDAAPTESLDAAIANENALTIDDSSLSMDAAVTPTEVATTTTTTETPETAPVLDAAPPIIETSMDQAEPAVTDTTSLAATGDAAAITETPIVDAPITETAAATEPSASETTYDPYASTEVTTPKPAGGVLKKIGETMPYQGKDGGWVNTVYVARPNEKLADISTKIFGSDKSKELKKIAENSYLKYRSVKAGDKIYYVSPNRPDDSAKTMVYFEDMGMVPETYVAKKGDNLRKVAKELLGYDKAWVEVWTSNGIESKKSLKDGDTIRYWKTQDSAMTAMASAPATTEPSGAATLVDATQAPAATAQTMPPVGDASGALPPPPADANANLPSPPEDAMAAAETRATADAMAPADPGLPPPSELAPPPPPPPPDIAAAEPAQKVNLDEAAAEEEEVGGLDSDTMMSMGALGVLVALMAFVIIRKKKQKASQMMNSEMNA